MNDDVRRERPVKANGTRECGVCGISYRALKTGDSDVVAHFDYAQRRWCPGGKPPTTAQKANRKKKGQSVRAVNGGLPTLGHRS